LLHLFTKKKSYSKSIMKPIVYLFFILQFLFVSQLTFSQDQEQQEQKPQQTLPQQTSSQQQLLDSKYKVWKSNGVGLMYGSSTLWLNYKHYFSKFALEGNFGYYYGGYLGFIPRFQVNFMKHYNVDIFQDIQLYWGLGLHYEAAQRPYFRYGLDALVGMEFNIIKIPLSIFTDIGVNPSYQGSFDSGLKWGFPARVGLRFRW
jgi:hypothetical protein